MKLTIHLVRGEVEILDVDQYTVLGMVEAFGDADVSVLQFALDDAMTYINKVNIVRIDVD